jgi:type IV pilus assembly protein PilB
MQIPVNEKGLTARLRSILRHILTRSWSAKSATWKPRRSPLTRLTGHLVFTTVHATTVDVIGCFLNMGVEPYNFVSALNCIWQRLVRSFANRAALLCTPPEALEASG